MREREARLGAGRGHKVIIPLVCRFVRVNAGQCPVATDARVAASAARACVTLFRQAPAAGLRPRRSCQSIHPPSVTASRPSHLLHMSFHRTLATAEITTRRGELGSLYPNSGAIGAASVRDPITASPPAIRRPRRPPESPPYPWRRTATWGPPSWGSQSQSSATLPPFARRRTARH